MFERPGRPADRFPAPFPNEQAARARNGGSAGPLGDRQGAHLRARLSLVRLRHLHAVPGAGRRLPHGAAARLRAQPPAGVTLPQGIYYNKYFPGHAIAMPPPLTDGRVDYSDGSPQTVDQYSKDVAAFLMWTAEPHLEARKRIGFQVMVFLIVLRRAALLHQEEGVETGRGSGRGRREGHDLSAVERPLVPDSARDVMTKAVLGIIGGSGIYDLPGLENVREERIASPWGEPSAPLRIGDIAGLPVVFLSAPRQGPPPVAVRHQLPRQYRRAEARRRHRSGFAVRLRLVQGGTAARHLRADRPVRRPHPRARELVLRQGLRGARVDGASGVAAAAHPSRGGGRGGRHPGARGGTYVCIEGPQFSTLAESLTYKGLGYSVIGMTNLPEAKLAREAELCYATVAMVTDFDCWHPDHDAVDRAGHHQGAHRQCREGETPGGAAGARFSARARAVPDRLRPRARYRHHHRAGSARSGAARRSSTRWRAGCSSG